MEKVVIVGAFARIGGSLERSATFLFGERLMNWKTCLLLLFLALFFFAQGCIFVRPRRTTPVRSTAPVRTVRHRPVHTKKADERVVKKSPPPKKRSTPIRTPKKPAKPTKKKKK
jgi:hypothetical protein